MKELIEKIKELQDVFKFHCCQVTCEQILGMIEDQESKPFNPVECGFTEIDMMYPEDVAVYEKNYYRLKLLKFNNVWLIEQFNKIINDEITLVRFIKIPNHRQGVELLRNLGVIDG